MPNIKSAKKRVLVNQTKAARNKAAANGLMHKNKAARKKHQLTIKLNAIEG